MEDHATPTNEELIEERIETFLEAYNSGDMGVVLESLDAKKRNAFQALLNLLGGVAGAAASIAKGFFKRGAENAKISVPFSF